MKLFIIIQAGFFALIQAAGILAVPPRQVAEPYDLIIRNGLVVDGTGGPPFRADVAVRRGKIIQIGSLTDAAAESLVDASHLVLAPGFIDVHTHADNLAATPQAENFIRMGVTSIVAGNCGASAVDVGRALEEIRETGTSINFATLIGHNSVRLQVMGRVQRKATSEELAHMKALVSRAMADGAVGFSTGLQYVPGTYADTAEILELAKTAAAAGGLYATHMRNEGTEIEKAIAEAIAIGEAAGCPVQVSHLKIDSPSRWGFSAKALAMIDAARKRGVQVRADQYAYTAGSSGLGIRFPSWVLEGGQERINRRLDDPSTWKRIKKELRELLAERGFRDLSWAVVASYPSNPSWNGKTIKQIALSDKGDDSADAQLEVARDMLRSGGARMVYHFMSEEDLERIMKHPQVMVASDSSVLKPGRGVPHPRGYGNNARVLGRFVREKGILTLPAAIRKMTSLPAVQFRFADRGLIKEGYAADLVLFDPQTIGDPSTYGHPHRYAEGVEDVYVNGVAVLRDGRLTGARPGQVLTTNHHE